MTTFVEIDMRNDFADDPRAVLPVPGTYALVGKMRVVEDACDTVLEVFDNHTNDDPISQEEFKTFPPHCIRETWGHERIAGLTHTRLRYPKNTYDFWKGNGRKREETIIQNILRESQQIIVGGVVTGICVKAFIDGAIERGLASKITVIPECVANLNIPSVKSTNELLAEWKASGVQIMTFDEFTKDLDR